MNSTLLKRLLQLSSHALLFLLLITEGSILRAQTIDVSVFQHNVMMEKKYLNTRKMIVGENCYYLVSYSSPFGQVSKDKKIYIHKYDLNHKLIWTKNLLEQHMEQFADCKATKSGFAVLYIKPGTKNKDIYNLKMLSLDGELINDIPIDFKTDCEKSDESKTSISYDMATDIDNDLVIITKTCQSFTGSYKNVIANFVLAFYDAKLELKRTITGQEKGNVDFKADFEIEKNQEVGILKFLSSSSVLKNNITTITNSYSYYLFNINDYAIVPLDYKLPKDVKLRNSFIVNTGSVQNVFSFKLNEYDEIISLYYLKFDLSTNTTIKFSEFELSKEFKEKVSNYYKKERYGGNRNSSSKGFEIKAVNFLKDGHMQLFLEGQWDGLAVCSIKDGELTMDNILYRKAKEIFSGMKVNHSPENYIIGYLFILSDDKTYIIYNDLARNLKKNTPDVNTVAIPNYGTDNIVTLAEISKDGSINKRALPITLPKDLKTNINWGETVNVVNGNCVWYNIRFWNLTYDDKNDHVTILRFKN